ncbi:MAG: M48 family metalloprotease [Bacteroidota bacterium]
MNLNYLYPEAPKNAPDHIIEPSASFRKEVRNVGVAIAAFILTYLLLVALAVGLAYVCIKAGIFVLSIGHSLGAMILSFGIMLMGAMVLFFLIKFLFASYEDAQAGGIEIDESDEPELFAFIRKVSEEVGTHFPRKVFLIPDVNASVFYNSSFLSLFFPTKKNLNIGLGLVNTLNVSQFKAVLAHEFGHFSQKSMRLGSYVYFVNQLIFNMLYRNTGWASAAEEISSTHSILALTTMIAVSIVQVVQLILRGMYGFINKQYKRLSREMEFHADAISARYAGSNNMAQCLRQVEIGTSLYQKTMAKCDELMQTKQAPANLYTGHRVLAEHFAMTHSLHYEHGIPVVTQAFVENQPRERVNYKDQWASHPTLEEREKHLSEINLETPVISDSAWAIFQQTKRWQRLMTQYTFRSIENHISEIEDPIFEKMIRDEKAASDLPKIYQGYFDYHIMDTDQWEEIEKNATPKALDSNIFNQLFNQNFDQRIIGLQKDLQTLNAISQGAIQAQSFDFDGQKYHYNQANQVQQQLRREMVQIQTERNRHDAVIVASLYAHALHAGTSQAEALKNAFEALRKAEALKGMVMPFTQPIASTIQWMAQNDFNYTPELSKAFGQLVKVHEPSLRVIFQQKKVLGAFTPEMQEKIGSIFGDKTPEYHYRGQIHRTNLENLYKIAAETNAYLAQQIFECHRELLILASPVE